MAFSRRQFLASAAVLPFASLMADPFDQSGVPIEVEPTDPKAIKIVILAGKANNKSGEHEYFAGAAILAKLLAQTPNIAPVMVRDDWPKNEKILDGAQAIVCYMNGGAPHPLFVGKRAERIQKAIDAGVGFVNLHQVVDYPKDLGDRARNWLGGCYEPGYSKRAHWVGKFENFPDHPISRGVTPFAVDDGWLWQSRFVPGMKGITPLVRTAAPAKKGDEAPDGAKLPNENIVGWTYDRADGGRSFTFTGAHLHVSWGVPGFRKFIVNGVLWAAKQEIPKDGAPVALADADLKTNLDKKPVPAPAKK